MGTVPFNLGSTILQLNPMKMLMLIILAINLTCVTATDQLLLQATNQIATTNDGVTSDKYVTYIQLNGFQGIQLTLDTIKLNQKLNYTIMTWFKPTSSLFGQDYQYVFSFGDSLECYFSSDQKLICSSESFIDRLEVDTMQLKTNQWFHLTVAGKLQDTSYALIQSNALGVIAQDEEYYLDLIQKTTPWKAWLGGCYNQNVFVGGLREFVVLNAYVNQVQAGNLKNKYQFWDSKLLAYYRFSEFSFFQDEIKGKSVQISSGAYKKQKDMISNDICYPIETYIQLYKAQKTQDFKTVAVSSRWQPKQTNWGYTVSLWLKLNPNHCYTSSPSIAKGNCHLVYLNEAFMLYSPAPNQVSAYIYASKVYYEYQTKSIFVPNNQWVNLQFTVNQFQGYEFRTYDILSRQMDAVIESRELFPQRVEDKNFIILKNFNSVIRSLVVYTSKQNLPFTPPKVDVSLRNYSLSSDCLMYFDFTTQGFASLLPRQLRNLCSPKSDFPLDVDLVPQNEIYQGVYWTDPKLIAGRDIGLSTNSTKLFDGIACNDGQAVANIRNSKGYIYAKTLPQQSQLNNVTVEFWFKQGYNSSSQTQIITNTNYLFSLYGPLRSREFFTVSYDPIQQKLICAPFGLTGVSSPQVAFTQYTQTNRGKSGWFHLACQFEQLNEVIGYLHNKEMNDEIRTQPLTGISTNLLQDTFEVWLGNNAQKSSGSPYLSLKEIRLWGLKRTYSDIQYWRYRQVDARLFDAASLMVYLRLNVGSYNEFNLMKIVNPNANYSDVNMTEVLYVSDYELSLCPVGTYLGFDSKCYQNPIQQIQANIYPELINSEQNYVFSSEETLIMSASVASFIQYQWIFEDKIVQKVINTLGINKNPIMKIPTKYFKDENTYKVTLNISNTDNTFVMLKQVNFIPRSCQYYQLTDQTQSIINMTDPQSRLDMSFMVQQVSLKSYCDEVSYYNQLMQNINYSFVPPLLNNVSLEFQYFSNNTFKVIVPAREQYKIPIKTPVTIILGLKFQNSQVANLVSDSQLSNDEVFQNIKQVIYFNLAGQTVIPAISANQTTVAIGEGVSLSTEGTVITYSDPLDYSKIYYQWLCPEALLNYCPQVNASQIIIPANNPINFKGASDFNATVTVNISWTDKNQIELVTNISLTIRFINQFSPVFTISATNPLRASYESLFSLDFTNHRSQNLPTSMTVTWDISPQIQFAAQTYGTKNSFLKVAKNGFGFSKTYKITVTATNRNTTQTLTRTQVYTFTTQKPPQNGTVSITPTSGYINETLMTITIQNWQSTNQPITYKIFPYKDLTKVSTVSLTENWITDSIPFRFTPNDTYYYQVWITDNQGELSIVNLMPNITVQSNNTNSTSGNLTWDIKQAQLNQILSSSVSQKYNELVSFTQNSQQDTSQSSSDSSSTDDQVSSDALQKMQTNLAILDNLQQDANEVSISSDQTDDSVIVSKGAVKVLELILSNTDIVNDEIAQKALEILRKIYNPNNSVIENINQDQQFKENFALVLSHLIKYDNSLSNSGRMLQQESTLQEEIRILKEMLTNQLCQDAVQNADPQSIDTPSFSIVIRKYSYDTSINEGELKKKVSDSPIIKFSISSISQELYPVKTFDDAFCIESIFLSIDPSLKNNAFQQYSSQIVEFNVREESSGQSFTTNQYDPQSNIKIIFPVNAETFLNNQTVCMGYSNISKDWTDDICETLVDTTDNNVRCYCNPTDVKSYGVFNNPSRLLGETLIFKPKASTSQGGNDYIQTDESFSFFALILILVVFSLVLPTLLIVLDKKDAKQIKNRKIENSLKQQVVLLSKYTNLPYKYWMTRIDDIIEYSQPSKSIFSHLVQELHPIVNIMAKYDVLNSRLTRFISYLLQLSIYAIVVVMVFRPSYRSGEQNRFEYGVDQKDINIILAVGILGTIILLPFNSLNRLYKRSIINKSVPQDQSPFQTNNMQNNELNYIPGQSEDKQGNTFSPSQDLQTIQRINYKSNGLENIISSDLFGFGRQSNLQKYENSQDLKFHSRCKPLLIVQMTISYLICICAIGLCFLNSQNMPVSNQYCTVASFYIGFFGSILVTNLIRVGINALLVQSYVENQGSCFMRLFIATESIELYKDIKIIRQSVQDNVNDNTQIQNLSQKQSKLRASKINNSNKKQTKEIKQKSIDISGDDNSLKRQIDTNENIEFNHSVIADDQIVRQKSYQAQRHEQKLSVDSDQVIEFNTKSNNSSNSQRKSKTEMNKNHDTSSPIKLYTNNRKNKTKVVEMSPDESLDRYSDIGVHSSPHIQELYFDEQDHHFV